MRPGYEDFGPPIRCESCGTGEGTRDNTGRLHCKKCGAFAQKADEYCVIHNVDYKGIYTEDSYCPYCREEQHQMDMHVHEMTRDPQMEPW